jgi:hypothetical protein
MEKWHLEAEERGLMELTRIWSCEVNQFEFKENICHLCRNIPSDLEAYSPMYGSEIMVRYKPYIDRIASDEGIQIRSRSGKFDWSAAENALRDLLGVPRIGEGWLSEMELLRLVRAALPNENVDHQASPDWLGRQRLDVFLPRLRLGIEYQGRQHFEPVDFFGGEAGFARNQERDAKKKDLCKQNGITLIYFRYDEDLSLSTVKSRLKVALKGE